MADYDVNIAQDVFEVDITAIGIWSGKTLIEMTATLNTTTKEIGFINGFVKEVVLMITAPYNAGTTITIGTDAAQGLLMTQFENDPTAGENYIAESLTFVNGLVKAFITNATTGTATVKIYYVT